MMKATLKEQVGKNVLSYVDDIVVASKKKTSYISDLAETYANMAKLGSSSTQRNAYLGAQEAKCLDV
jgi:hypothetical protein